VQSRQHEEERAEVEEDFRVEREEADRAGAEALSNLRADVERSSKESETRRLLWREREADLMRQLGTEAARADALADDLVQCQFADKEMDQRLRELRRSHQQRESASLAEFTTQRAILQVDSAALGERAERAESERDELRAAAESVRTALLAEEQRSDAMQADILALRQRLDAEHAHSAREADETHAAAIVLEEQRRTAAMQQLAASHKQQLGKLEAVSKRALQKAARKKQDLRQRCQELVKRMGQLQQERITVERVCEENKAAYEVHLTELGLISRLGLGNVAGPTTPALHDSASTAGANVMRRCELRSIMERLEEQSADRLKAAPATAPEGHDKSPCGAAAYYGSISDWAAATAPARSST